MSTLTNADKQFETMKNTDKLVEKAQKAAKPVENPEAISGLVTCRANYKSPRDGGMHLLPPCPNCNCARYSPCTCTKRK